MYRMEAVAILAGTHRLTKADRHNGIIKGLNLLLEIQGDDADLDIDTVCTGLYIDADQHTLFAGNFTLSVERMTPEQVAQMAKWGWSVHENVWQHRTAGWPKRTVLKGTAPPMPRPERRPAGSS
jgi:hypothetical protein